MADDQFEELSSRVIARATTFEKTILRRDLVETAAAIFVIVGFGFFMMQHFYPWIAKIGMLVVILGAIEIVVVLHWTRRYGQRPQNDLPLTEYCGAEIARVDRQIRLLRNINWWYSGPILLGVCVILFGLVFSEPLPLFISLPIFLIFCALVLAGGWIVYRINQGAVTRELIPAREELSALHRSLMAEPTKSEGI